MKWFSNPPKTKIQKCLSAKLLSSSINVSIWKAQMSYVEKLIKDSMIRSFFIYYPLSDLDFYRYRLQLGSFFCSFFSTNRYIWDSSVSISEKHTQVFRWKTNKGFNDQISFYHLLTSQWAKIWNSTKFRGHYYHLSY